MSETLHLGLWSRARIKLIRQSEIAECGLACLAMIANYHGLDIDLGTLRRRFAPSLRGASLKSLIGIADQLGLVPRAVKLPLGEVPNLHMPAILHWDMSHYVVLERIEKKLALIHNPDGRRAWYGADELSNHFTGVALELRPADDFEPSHQRERLRLPQLWRRITGLKRAMAQILVLSLVLELFVLCSPYYMQIAVDDALPALDRDLLLVLALGFGLFTAINATTSFLRSFVLLSAGSNLGFSLSVNIVRRLFRLPIDWFEKRHVGDVLSRFQSVAPIQQMLTTGAVAVLLDGALAIFTLALMFVYNSFLAIIALAAFALYGLTRAITFPLQREAQEGVIVAGGKEQSIMIESLRGITTLRLFNREAQRHALWQSRMTDSINAQIALSRIGIWQGTANTLIFGLESIISIWLSIRFIIDGSGFSIGMLFAYMSYKTQFLAKSSSLIDQAIAFRMLNLHLERLSDIALSKQDISFLENVTHQEMFTGRIELKNVRYRYSPNDPWVLDGINLVVEPNSHIAITGPSGGGKSTLVKIILGLLEPVSGEVLIDGISLAQYGYKNYHDRISAVLQEDCLFAGSLADNIALFDDTPDMELVKKAAVAASIHKDITRMPMQYESFVGDMGSTLSGGQKQRVLLARALYRQPQMLVMDEGTAHLDSAHESHVILSIAQLGITRIMIAHRAETVASADIVYFQNDGQLERRPPSED